ncbi:MAG: EAL domain-containing protein [Spirochaetales bacterium]
MSHERILIVEDEKIIALDLKRRLERYGYVVVGLASEGQEAVELAGAELPDLILMDIMLSNGSDGVTAATEIRSRFRIPVVFLTAYADETTIQRAKAAEPVGYVLKPFKEKELHTTIDIGLYKSRVDRQLVRQERLFSSILRSAGDAIVATDRYGSIQYINPAAELLTGWKEDEAKGVAIDEVLLFTKDDSGESISIGQASGDAMQRPRHFESVVLKNRIGAEIHIEGSISAIKGERNQFEGMTVAFRDTTEVRQLNETVTYQARHDSLTGLINREAFASELERIATEAADEPREHAFLFVDIDQFKIINDVCGHQAGDELLRQVADGIESIAGVNCVLARIGGDQFGAILLETDLDTGAEIAQNVTARLKQRFVWQNAAYNVTVSVGLAPIVAGSTNVNDILAAGEDACNLAKEHGGNSYRAFKSSDFVFLKRRGEMRWISKLTRALEEDRFVFYHQVIQHVREPDTKKYEVLLRLRETNGELVQPGQFIAAAERYKLMPSIDRWVIAGAARYARQAREREIALPTLCINLSGASIADPHLMDYMLETWEEEEIEGSCFCLEVTETSAIQNFSRATAFIQRIKDTGATFALDDFGNGFSSFGYLKRLPVDYLKIDGSFVKDIERDPIDLALVEAVNRIGQTMGMSTIAEYVTNDNIRKMLTDVGVDYVQGYAISTPAPLPYAGELSSIA